MGLEEMRSLAGRGDKEMHYLKLECYLCRMNVTFFSGSGRNQRAVHAYFRHQGLKLASSGMYLLLLPQGKI